MTMFRTSLRRTLAACAMVVAATSFAAPNDVMRPDPAAYFAQFNATDDECYTNEIPNSAATSFLLDNIPRFACPDKDIERAYYFRWWTFRKHLRHCNGRWIVTEFLPAVGWAGTSNTIVCAAGHHLREGRWLRNQKIAEDNVRFWLSDPASSHRWKYSSWLFTGARLAAAVSGNDALPRELLDDAVAYYRRWEEGFERSGWPIAEHAWMGGDGKGGFLSIDNYEGTECSLGHHGYKPLFSSAMWSEANAISAVAREAGRLDLAREFAAKAEAARRSLLDHCWNPDLRFFTTCDTNGQKGVVRELHGYAPWYFGVPTDSRAPDWSQLTDPQGFAARFGLSFPERRAKGFELSYTQRHKCLWNGPSWPFATSIALTALANDIRSRPNRDPALVKVYFDALRQYAAQQVLTRPDGSVVPWIDEDLNPDTGDWMVRTMIIDRKDKIRERGKDYNHSTFCDLVISGLVGFIPKPDGSFDVDPLFPKTWEYLTLENLRYRGRDITIAWRPATGLAITTL